MKSYLFIPLLFLFIFTKARNNLDVTIDKRMEAVSIFYTLATADTLDVKPAPSIYYRDLKTYFEKYKLHRALEWYRKLDFWDGFDIASIGLSFSKKYPFTIQYKLEANYIKSAPIDTFVRYFNNFYKDAKVERFINQHQKMYANICLQVKDTVLTSGVLSKIKSFYAAETDGKFITYLDLLNNMGSNAILSKDPHFNNDRMFRLGYIQQKKQNLTDQSPINFNLQFNVFIHEISHIYFADFMKTYHDRLKKISDRFLTTTKGEVLKQGLWENEAEELLVRVCTARIIINQFGKAAGEAEINNQAKHFKWALPIYHFFENYDKNRTQYPSIQKFYPILIDFLETKT